MKIGSILRKGVMLWVSQSYKSTHQALDFGKPTISANTPVYAVEDGAVIKDAPSDAPQVKDYGFVLKGKSGAFYLYNHCYEGRLGEIKRGQVIGKVDTVERQNIFRKKWGANPLLKGAEHCHFEIHPTGDWNVRDNPLYYFDRKEVQYNRQPACTSTQLNYVGLPDKQLTSVDEKMYKEKYEKTKKELDKMTKLRDTWRQRAKDWKGKAFGCNKLVVEKDKQINNLAAKTDNQSKMLVVKDKKIQELKKKLPSEEVEKKEPKTALERIKEFLSNILKDNNG